MTTPTPLWERMATADIPQHVIAEQIGAVWDWLHETFGDGDDVSNVVYNSLSQQAIEAAQAAEEVEAPEARPVVGDR